MAALHMGIAEIGVQLGDGIVARAGRIMPLPPLELLGRRRTERLVGLDGKRGCGHGLPRHDSARIMVPHAERTAV